VAVKDKAWLAIAAIAIGLGVWVRFKGFGVWPLAVDEYYIFRSVGFIVESGLPEYPCGGFYTRGLVYQYALAPLIIAGMPPESALRLITILSSLLVLPAVYLLTRSLAPADARKAAACAAVAVLALSAWEIEMARFGRMYAPFQAVFVWYLYHTWQLINRQELWRWRWLVGLSILGPFVWEGGVMLAVLNFLPMLLGRTYWRMPQLALAALPVLIAYISRGSFRHRSSIPAFPEEYLALLEGGGESRLAGLLGDVLLLAEQPVALRLAAVGLAILALVAAGSILRQSRPGNPLAYLAVIATVVALALNQFVLAAALLVGSWLLGWVDRHTLGEAGWRRLLWVGGLTTAGWVALLWARNPDALFTLDAIRVLQPLYAFPDFKMAIVQPWFYTIPLWSALLTAGLIGSLAYVGRADACASRGIRWLLLTILACATFVALAPTPYRETRYSYFLYPALIVASIVGLSGLRTTIRTALRWPAATAPVAILLAFLATEDFQPRHLLTIDSYQANFRVGYPERLVAHYYERNDHKALGDFLREHAQPGDAIIITEVALQPYLPWLDYVYLWLGDERFGNQSCRRGTVERWSNVPLLFDEAAVKRALASRVSGSTWIVVTKKARRWHAWEQSLVDHLASAPVFTPPDGSFEIYRVQH
jgi:hypothetical protein